MSVVQSRGRGRIGLDEVKGTARSGSGLHARTSMVDQGSAAAVVGSDGGSTGRGSTGRAGLCDNGHTLAVVGTGGSAGQKNRRTRRLRARVTRQAAASQLRWRAGHGRSSEQGRFWREYEWNENEAPFFFIEPLDSQRVQGS